MAQAVEIQLHSSTDSAEPGGFLKLPGFHGLECVRQGLGPVATSRDRSPWQDDGRISEDEKEFLRELANDEDFKKRLRDYIANNTILGLGGLTETKDALIINLGLKSVEVDKKNGNVSASGVDEPRLENELLFLLRKLGRI
jgi:hypothetical protein